jgi:NADPH:quinone reductase-like Zn-dependent oxidoreductase
VVKAIVQDRFGSPDMLELRELDEPEVGDGDVLVRVRAASVNPADWYAMMGVPYVARPQMGLRKPRTTTPGLDLAGVVAAVGNGVTHVRPGDEVFGASTGTLAEYVTAAEDALVLKPPNLSFEQAAAVPVAALTALQGLRDKGRIRPGQQVLINGASGGVGTFAVQLARWFGAEVTGVCSTRNVDMVGSLGADRVIDYTQKARSQDLLVLRELLEAGTLTPVVERSYPLAEAAEALRHLGAGHARGKLAIVVGEPAREHGVDPAG